MNKTAKYDTRELCDYPYIPDDALGYCWGYANIVDGTFKQSTDEYCKNCEFCRNKES